MQPDALDRLVYWINERHAIYMRKWWLEQHNSGVRAPAQGMSRKLCAAWEPKVPAGYDGSWTPKYLTDDPVLFKYRFCNVYRELDRVTIWIRKNIREPFADNPNLWFMCAIARYINWPPTIQELLDTPGAWPRDERLFRPEYMTAVMEARRARGDKVEGGAFMTRAESDKNAPWYSWSKQRYVSEVVLGKLWEAREAWSQLLDRPLGKEQPRLQTVWENLLNPHWTGYGPFTAGQLVTDLRWTHYLREAPDIQTWTALGPGSRRGLNRLAGREVSSSLSQERGLEEMLRLREVLAEPGRLAPWVGLPDLSDVQNCLCEYDKYERVRLGQGEPRSRYVPGRGC